MKNNLKLKILAGFMMLVALLMAAGAVSTIEFLKLGKSVTALIDDNYKTIEASKSMLEALEREDSGILLVLLDEVDTGREILHTADSMFVASFKVAKNNITEVNEDVNILRIDSLYREFKNKWSQPFSSLQNQSGIGVYHKDIHKSFVNVKSAVNELMTLNQRSMFTEATMLKEKSHRAIMPGIVAIIGGLVFSLLLSFFISKYFVSPISEIAEAVKNFNIRDKALRTNIKSNDEIKKLETEINSLIFRLTKDSETKVK
jgi:HAMP domain-containing protein